jgi:GxxExxY protein
MDLLVEDSVIVELKAADELLPIHQAQLLTYLRVSGKRFGLLINFNVIMLKDGIQRVLNGYPESPCDLRVLRDFVVK